MGRRVVGKAIKAWSCSVSFPVDWRYAVGAFGSGGSGRGVWRLRRKVLQRRCRELVWFGTDVLSCFKGNTLRYERCELDIGVGG